MSSWLSGSSNLSSRLTKALRNSRLWPNRNGSGQGPFIQPDVTIYLLLAILVLLIFLCVAVMAFFYVSQTGRADEGTAVPPTTTLDETTEVIVIIATPTITSTLPAPTAVPTPVLPPMTCSDLQRHDPLVTDDEYTLFLNRNPAFPVSIYCHNMTAVPAEYITLNNTGDNTNFASTAYPDDELITRYAKVRVDLHTLVLDPTDRTFATVTGSVPFYSNVPYNDYGRAVGCNEARPGIALGRGNIDLSGTNFTLDETAAFTLRGTDVEGSGAQIAPDGLIVTLEAGGRCGWVAPDGPLHLNYVPSATQTGAP
jgi:hypothetical protein